MLILRVSFKVKFKDKVYGYVFSLRYQIKFTY
jgi:hypothetical protein